MRVLVLGGTGFIGRHVAAALLARGHEVCIGTRHPARAARRLPEPLRSCERREVHFECLATRGDWHVVVAGCHAVVNAVGILRPRGDTLPALGDTVWLVPGHCDPTVNLHDQLYAFRGEDVEEVWPVVARGYRSP